MRAAYLDASVIVPLFLAEPFTERAKTLLRTPDLALVVADWAMLEVSNVVARPASQAPAPGET